MTLIATLQELELALAGDDHARAALLIDRLAGLVGDQGGIAVARRLLDERRLRRHEAARRAAVVAEVNDGYAALRADPVAWAEFLAERRIWDAALADGLESV